MPPSQTMSKKMSKKTAARRPASRGSANRKTGAGALPEWNLNDLYSGLDDPAITRDLDRTDVECVAFENAYKGKLADLARSAEAAAALAEAVRRYEAIDDLMGRLSSYAGLLHAGNTVDPARTKFYGDVQERLTAASTHLLFFSLELNRIDDALIEAAMQAAALGHYRPWLEDVRRYRPYQLEDRVEQLFHEKSMTAFSAWNRLFDATIANLRFKVQGKTLAIEPTLNLMQDRAGAKRKAAAQALAHTFKANVPQFALITNTLAKDKEISDRWRGFADIADARHLDNRVEREVVDALVAAVRAAYPRLSHRYYALKAKWFGKKTAAALGPQRAAAAGGDPHHRWVEARNTVLTAYGAFSPKMATIAERFFRRSLDRRAGAAGQGAGRVRASDDAVGASLCAAQLPGQAARRDDARA
jgi:oligoendopeptidase F